MRAHRLPLAPLPEQHRIVAAIEQQFTRLDAAAADLHQARAKLKRYRAAVLGAACSGRLVPIEAELVHVEAWRDETGHPFSGDGNGSDDRIGTFVLPKGWSWVALGRLLREPLRNGHSAKASGTELGVRTLTLTAVTNGDFSARNTKLTTADPNRVKDLWLEPGDIFVERSNTPNLVGTARLYQGPSGFAIFPDLLIRVRVIDSESERYVQMVLQTEEVRRYFRSRAQGIAGSMPKIDQATVERVPVPLPPLAEQHRIVAEVERRLSVVEEMEATVAANLKRAERMRQAILRRAFAGQLVPQDPNDEPARSRLPDPIDTHSSSCV